MSCCTFSNTLLVYRLVRQWGGERSGAFLLALVFAIHPLRWESVGWISERKGLLSSLFALWQSIATTPTSSLPDSRGWRSSLSASRHEPDVEGDGGHPALCPPVTRLVPLPPLEVPVRSAALIAEKWPLWLLVAASCIVTYIAQKAGGAVRTLEEGAGRPAVRECRLGLHDVCRPDALAGEPVRLLPHGALPVRPSSTLWPSRS